ncbi:uncharacterized protein METZ01_LOCUS507153, partial [marine metagenome]
NGTHTNLYFIKVCVELRVFLGTFYYIISTLYEAVLMI